MLRKTLKTRMESDIRFWDFVRQFFFRLLGFKQGPYPPGRLIDDSQAIGYEKLKKRYYDFIMRSGGWFYKDWLGWTRGPLELKALKFALASGKFDTNTFIWGDDMDEWASIGMVYGLEKAIATLEVTWPWAAAKCRGDKPWPLSSLASSGLRWITSRTKSACPSIAAICKGSSLTKAKMTHPKLVLWLFQHHQWVDR